MSSYYTRIKTSGCIAANQKEKPCFKETSRYSRVSFCILLHFLMLLPSSTEWTQSLPHGSQHLSCMFSGEEMEQDGERLDHFYAPPCHPVNRFGYTLASTRKGAATCRQSRRSKSLLQEPLHLKVVFNHKRQRSTTAMNSAFVGATDGEPMPFASEPMVCITAHLDNPQSTAAFHPNSTGHQRSVESSPSGEAQPGSKKRNFSRLLRFSRAASVVAEHFGDVDNVGEAHSRNLSASDARRRRQKAYRALANRALPGAGVWGGIGGVVGLE